MEPRTITIHGETILLQALLKLVGAIGNGGEVRFFLAENRVEVNGEPEARRGRQLRDGDVVALPDGSRVRVVGTPLPSGGEGQG